jgi:hypothetical protein
MGNKSGLVIIRTVQGDLSAHLIKSRLENEGIPAMLQWETYFNLILAIHAPISIIISEEHAHEAKKLVDEIEFDLITTISKKRLWLFAILRLLAEFG